MRLWKSLISILITIFITNAYASSDSNDYARCLRAVDFYEQKYQIPRNLLYALTIVESGKWQKEHGITLPYPWVLNVEGAPYFFENKQQAVLFLKKSLAQGKKSIDVGCGQVNIHYHGHHFEKPENLLNPVYNIAYAAYFIARNFSESGHWPTAIAQYHSRTPELGKAYWGRIQVAMNKIHQNKSKYDHIRYTHSAKIKNTLINTSKNKQQDKNNRYNVKSFSQNQSILHRSENKKTISQSYNQSINHRNQSGSTNNISTSFNCITKENEGNKSYNDKIYQHMLKENNKKNMILPTNTIDSTDKLTKEQKNIKNQKNSKIVILPNNQEIDMITSNAS